MDEDTPQRLGLRASSDPPGALPVRTLSPEEEKMLTQGLRPKAPGGVIKRLRHTHHQIARYMAQGLKDVEIAAVMGYSQSRLSVLKNDPTFMAQVQFYMDRQDEAMVDVQTRLLSYGLDAAQELHERILDGDETISSKALLDTAVAFLDRAGFAPVQRTVNANLGGTLSPQVQEQMRESIRRSHVGHVTTKGSGRPAVGGSNTDRAKLSEGKTEGECGEGEGIREGHIEVAEEPEGEGETPGGAGVSNLVRLHGPERKGPGPA